MKRRDFFIIIFLTPCLLRAAEKEQAAMLQFFDFHGKEPVATQLPRQPSPLPELTDLGDGIHTRGPNGLIATILGGEITVNTKDKKEAETLICGIDGIEGTQAPKIEFNPNSSVPQIMVIDGVAMTIFNYEDGSPLKRYMDIVSRCAAFSKSGNRYAIAQIDDLRQTNQNVITVYGAVNHEPIHTINLTHPPLALQPCLTNGFTFYDRRSKLSVYSGLPGMKRMFQRSLGNAHNLRTHNEATAVEICKDRSCRTWNFDDSPSALTTFLSGQSCEGQTITPEQRTLFTSIYASCKESQKPLTSTEGTEEAALQEEAFRGLPSSLQRILVAAHFIRTDTLSARDAARTPEPEPKKGKAKEKKQEKEEEELESDEGIALTSPATSKRGSWKRGKRLVRSFKNKVSGAGRRISDEGYKQLLD